MILTIRTEKPEAEIGLYKNGEELAYEKWQAHRQLAETIHKKIAELLKEQNLTLSDIKGIVAYKGPGSYTGLRIGISVANALAYSLGCGAVGVGGPNWKEQGMEDLKKPGPHKLVLPEYEAPAHTTQPRK